MRLSVLLCAMALALSAQERTPKKPAFYEGRSEPARREAPPSARFALAAPRELAMARPSAEDLAVLEIRRDPPLIGVHRAVAEEALAQGTWELAPDGQRVWRLTVRSPGALGIRFQFSEFDAGAGKLWVHGTDGTVDGPHSARGPFDDGQFWSSTVFAEAATIEFLPGEGVESLPFRVTRLSHQARRLDSPGQPDTVLAELGPLAAQAQDPAAGCNQDVNCYPEWQDAARMVALITFETEDGPASCTGTAVATRNNTFKPYFLTAAHCISEEGTARSVEAYWAYLSASCRAGYRTDRGTLRSPSGGNLLVTTGLGGGDSSLLRLREIPSGVGFSGWDPGETGLGSYLVGIHHPVGSYKRISFGNRVQDRTAQIGPNTLPGASFYQVLWQRGVTEPGSSGSPAFSSPGMLVGVLSYGIVAEDICDVPVYDAYGRFSVAYPVMRDWLEDLPFTAVAAAPATLAFSGANGSISAPASQSITITTQSRNAVPFNARADARWIQLSRVAGQASSGTPGTIQVSIDAAQIRLAGTYQSTVTITSGSAPPQYVTVRVDMRVDRSSVTASVTPSPVVAADEPYADGARWSFTLRLQETAGMATRVTTLKINAADYSSRIAEWFGTDRIAASGRIEARLRMANLSVPTEQYFEVGGVDASGQRWYVTLAVPFQ